MRADILERLRKFSTCELCDGMEKPRVMIWQIKPMVSEEKIVGTAFPVKVPEGVSGIIPDAILQAQPGDVLVIGGHGLCSRSYWGDHRSLCARMRGLEGVVIDGAFRDLDGCREIGFPIYAKAVVPCSAGKEAEGELNVPIRCGCVCVYPGDYIVGDCSGIVVIRPDEAEQIMARAAQKVAAQKRTIEHMRQTGEILPRVKLDAQ